MNDGFVRVAALSPSLAVGDPQYNQEQALELMEAAAAAGARVLVLPECALPAYTCQDLFLQTRLLATCEEALASLIAATAHLDAISVAGTVLAQGNKLYNVAAVFSAGPTTPEPLTYAGFTVPFGTHQLFTCTSMPQLTLAVEICEDLWVPQPPSVAAAAAGATLVVNPSASDAVVGKAQWRRDLVAMHAARTMTAYVYASSGPGESTQDLVFCAHNLIAENGRVLAESKPFEAGLEPTMLVADVDLELCLGERRRTSTYPGGGISFVPPCPPPPPGSGAASQPFSAGAGVGVGEGADAACPPPAGAPACPPPAPGPHALRPRPGHDGYLRIPFTVHGAAPGLLREVDPHPFVPAQAGERASRAEEVLSIQAHGLAKRLSHVKSDRMVLGISGGLDSTLALLVAARACDLIEGDRAHIEAVTMPGFGTTNRTYTNALTLARELGATVREVPIAAAVTQHFEDIGHDPANHNVVYENAQARERTQVLMDIANELGALVVGTGDLSELACGWATYNGDHMSNYGVNAGVPKTLVRYVVAYEAERLAPSTVSAVLEDVLATPVSPELLPAQENGEIAQKTEELVGPYELHDFFLYGLVRYGWSPKKIFRLAKQAFAGTYDAATIKRWMAVFYRRFFSQQFKRSCLPDGPKVGSVSLSPRGDWRMPSDAVAHVWLQEVAEL
jgi:NAD+ synthase (glutamine-hydrolysing)